MNKVLFSVVAFIMPFLSLQAGLTGVYNISGYDPYAEECYTGKICIGKDCEVYTAKWTYDGDDTSGEIGTGVYNDGQLSFVFQSEDDPSYVGVQVYEVSCHGLKGPWVPLAGEKIGSETLAFDHKIGH